MTGIGRRTVLGGIGAAGAIAAALPAQAAAQGTQARVQKLDLSDPAGRLHAYVKMRGSLDESLVIGYVSGSYFGIVGSEVTPLWDVYGATFSRYRKRQDGAYDVATGEIAHFVDPKTGEAPGRFTIPYTGKTVTDPRTNLPPNRLVIHPGPRKEIPRMAPGTVSDDYTRPPEVRGNDLWFTDITRVTMPQPSGGEPFRYSEMVTMRSYVSDLENADLTHVPCDVGFTNVVAWRPWMEMGDHPGHLMAIGRGRIGVPLDLLPEIWTRATREKWPEVLEDPGALIEPVWQQIKASS